MKSIWIFLILYTVAVAKVYIKDECSTDAIVQYTQNKFPNLTDLIDHIFDKNPSDDTLMCMVACQLQDWADQRGLAPDTFILNATSEVYAKGFKTKKFTREEVESKVVNCKNTTADNCAFVKCLDFPRAPFLDIIVYDQPLIHLMVVVAQSKTGRQYLDYTNFTSFIDIEKKFNESMHGKLNQTKS